MEMLKTWLLWSMLATFGLSNVDGVQAEQDAPPVVQVQEVVAEPLSAEPVIEPDSEPIKAETITEHVEKEPEKEPEESEADTDECVIDNSVIESCDHKYTRTHGTGGEEGDVWEYVCSECGDTYFEPYECVESEVDGEMEEYETPKE